MNKLPTILRFIIVGALVVIAGLVATFARDAEQDDVAERGEIVLNNATAGTNRITLYSDIEGDVMTLTAAVEQQGEPVVDPQVSATLLGLGGLPRAQEFVVDPAEPTVATLDIDRPDVERFVGQLQIAGGPIAASTEFIVAVPQERTKTPLSRSVLYVLIPVIAAVGGWLALRWIRPGSVPSPVTSQIQ